MWTFQEVVVASAASVHCGQLVVPWQRFRRAVPRIGELLECETAIAWRDATMYARTVLWPNETMLQEINLAVLLQAT